MNIANFTGNIGRDAEIRSLNNGDQICNFTLAVNVGSRANPETMWVDCKLWGERGVKVQPYLVKGARAAVTGRVKLETYQAKTGEMKTVLQMTVNDLDIFGRRDQDAAPAPAMAPAAKAPTAYSDINDEIPF